MQPLGQLHNPASERKIIQFLTGEATEPQQTKAINYHSDQYSGNRTEGVSLRQSEKDRIGPKGQQPHDCGRNHGDNKGFPDFLPVRKGKAYRTPIQHADNQRESDVADDQRLNAQSGKFEQRIQDQHMQSHGNGAVDDRRAHLIDTLQHRAGDGRQREKDHGGRAIYQ